MIRPEREFAIVDEIGQAPARYSGIERTAETVVAAASVVAAAVVAGVALVALDVAPATAASLAGLGAVAGTGGLLFWRTSGGRARRRANAGGEVIDALPYPVLVSSRGGLPRRANAAYHAMNRRFGFSRLATPLRWAASDPDAAAALYRAVRQAGEGEPGRARLTLGRAGEAESLDIQVMPAGRASDGLVFSILPAPSTAAPAEPASLAAIFDRMPVALALVSKDGAIAEATPRFWRLLFGGGQGRAEADADLWQAVAEPDRTALIGAVTRGTDGEDLSAPIDVTLEGEPPRAVRLYVAPFSEDGTEAGGAGLAIVYAVDTTEQRALEMQFAQSQKMQAVGQLAGGVAHDFNNILTAIIGFSDLLLMNHRPTDPSFQDIMNIKQNANRAAGLVKQLLAYSRRQTLRPSRLHLTDVLADLTVMLDRLLGEKVTLKVVHGRDLWPVLADVSQLEQVIINLSVNARDAMPDGGELIIRTTNLSADAVAKMVDDGIAPGDFVMVEVVDTGTGMPQHVIDKIFEPFFSTKEVGRGTGLGLSTVYGIVKQTGGTILVDSRPGEGTTFRVLLPRATAAAEADPLAGVESGPASAAETTPLVAADAGIDPVGAVAEPAAAPEPAAEDLTGSATILLVEDEDTIRAFAERALSTRGYVVHQAPTGEEALALARELDGEIDLLVSDVVMPEMDGPTLAVELRKLAPDVPIILMSGYAEDVFSRTLPEDLDFAFLPKPFALKALATAVKDALEGRSAG
ncbi:ATP-binding protein [Amorphus orientalis]|uniref:histidine kinase n=1 Tax=Amorphus orientalis TaxID=649198 RepID=A0AAE3VSW5_9HYPH|nr:ATP-binding protein [Amorphus orientalis]MDQ0317521.1 two-component system cell cycle sensor histidine kinase/response regulator CckA [Amorphus orientalis]